MSRNPGGEWPPLSYDPRRNKCETCGHVDMGYKFSNTDNESRFEPESGGTVLAYDGEEDKPLISRATFYLCVVVGLALAAAVLFL